VVSGYIAVKFILPKLLIALRHGCLGAAFMAVPITAVDKKSGFVFRENYIRGAGKLVVLDSETKPGPVEERSNNQFRFGVSASHTAHIP
jgi:hypothetical protein